MSRGFSRFFIVSVLAATLFPAFLPAQEPAAAPDKHASRRAIQKALMKQVDWKFAKTPLAEVVQKLREELKIPILLYRQSLEELGVSADTPVTFEIGGITAKSALSLILCELGLTTMIRDEVLLITSPDVADTNLYALPYDVTDLVLGEDGIEDVMFDELIELITKTVKPTTWDEVGGPGSIQPFESVGIISIVVAQTDEVHEELVDLLADLRALRKPGVILPKAVPPVPGTPVEKAAPPALSVAETAARAAERKIRAALKKKVSLEYHEEALLDVIEHLEKQTSQKFYLDKNAIGVVEVHIMGGVERLSPEELEKKISEIKFTIRLRDVQLETAFDLLLHDAELGWTIKNDLIWITSIEEADNNQIIRTCDVSDLSAFRTKEGKIIPDYDNLIETITGTIRPTTWENVGGPATIHPLDTEGIQALVIGQTWQAHEEIADLLANLRKQRKTPLTKEELEKLPPPPESVRQSNLDIVGCFDKDGKLVGGVVAGVARQVKPLPPLEPDAARDAIVQANNQFAFDLYLQLRERDRNLFFSPYSIATVLAMAHSGARGAMADEMAKALHFSLKQAEIPAGYRSLLNATLLADRPGCEINVANRLWCQQGYKFREPFLEINRKEFNSEIGLVDFKQSEAVRKQMNDWIEEKTKKRIKDAVPPGAIHGATRFAIINAIYFKGKWEVPFLKIDTKNQPFYADDNAFKVPMMSLLDSKHRYAELDDLQLLEKTYLGGDVSMLIVLPKKQPGALDFVEARLSNESLQEWTEALGKRAVDLYLPRFNMETTYSLLAPLEKMGMQKAFSLNEADFSGIKEESEPLAIDMLMHKTYLQVDEEGTVAAAATGMGFMGGIVSKPKIPVFRADHPFLFLLRDTRTGCILFMGRVMQPPRERQAE
ncbi:MAG: hypothetical protein IT426_12835 [Pirellulales bacterium]|nr:hypothetical protein [Pirellulales bacterium]